MKSLVDVAVVGAGPAGLAAGIAAASPAERVVVLERNAVPGRKFLLSGSGQCNVTHGGAIDDFPGHYGDGKKSLFVKPALLEFDHRRTIDFFEQRGEPLFEREDGKVFPTSLKSGNLLRILREEFERKGGMLQTETVVGQLKRTDSLFQMETERGPVFARRVVLATGGRSYPKTGSRGDGFRFAEQLGHRIVTPRKALAPIVVNRYSFAASAGTSFRDRPIALVRNGKRIRSGQGDVLLTHRGLSGPGILDLSRWIEPGDVVRLSLCRDVDLRRLLVGKKTLKNALVPLGIPDRFLTQWLESLEIPPDRSASETTRQERRRLEEGIGGCPFTVERLGDWNEAMATAGGVALEEVDRRTMQSRIVPGLFFCGEVLDIDGDTGGYNIQFALSSGFLAGRCGGS